MGKERRDMRHLSKGWAKGPVILGILFAVLFALGMMAEEIQAASYPFKSVTIYADGTRTAKFICNGMSGFCCEAGAYSAYSGTATLTRLENTTNAAHCAYWYGYCRGWTTGANAHKLARLLSYCMGHGTGGDYKESTMRSLLKRAREEKVPAGFECWHGSPSGSSRQDFIVWKYPKGKLKVTKKSSDTSISNKGSYTLAGMTIKVYSDAGCKNCVKTLTTKKNGTTGGAFQLPVGTYYVKETKVPGATGYKLNGKVHKIKIGEGKTASVSIGNKPDTGTIRVRKKVTGKDGETEGFRFIIKGKKSGKKYVLTTGPDGTAKISGLPFGKYTITEDLTEEQQKHYVDQTGPQTVVLAKGSDQEITVARENLYEQQQLRIVKRTEDGGPVKGFTFRVSWLLANSLQITGEEIVKAAAPKAELAEDQSLGIWQIEDENVIGKINEDAKAGCTGTFEVVLRNTVTTAGPEEPAEQEPSKQEPAGEGPEAGEGTEEGEKPETGEQQKAAGEAGEDSQDPAGIIVTTEEDGETLTKEEIRIKVQLELCSRASAPDTSGDRTGDRTGALSAAEHKEDHSGACLIEHEDLVFYGAADKGDREVVTDAAGQYAMEDIQPGEYTVTEIMDEKQKRRYRQPASQTKTIEADGEETYLFTFVNEPILIPVRLQKTSADGKIDNIEFTVTGKPDYTDEPIEEITVRTGEDGVADLGEFYPGTYRIEETEFDKENYVNTYPEEGGERPAFAFTITGDELSEEEIRQGRSLWLGGEPEKGGISAEQVSFVNVPYVNLRLTKVDGVSRSFLPGATFSLTGSDGALAARFRIDEKDQQPAVVMLETNGIITALSAAETEGEAEGPPVVIGDEEEAQEDEAGGSQEDTETGGDPGENTVTYQCVVLRGLVCGEVYTLTEEKAPEGFTALKEPYVFSVTLDENGAEVLNTCDEYGTNIAAAKTGGTLVVVNDAPSIGTICLDDESGGHTAEPDKEVLLTDTCEITNLTAGETYTLIARLMDVTKYKKSGNIDDVKQVVTEDGPVMGRTVFKAEEAEDTVEVPIRLNGTSLAGRSTVVYESLYQGEVSFKESEAMTAAAEEVDPKNENQSIIFEKPQPKGPVPKTGDRFRWLMMVVLTMGSAATIMFTARRRQIR